MLVSLLMIAALALAISRATAQQSAIPTTSSSPIASPLAVQTVVGSSVNVTDHVTIHVTDTGYTPWFVQATNGHDLTITVINDGTRAHGFTIDGLGIDLTVQPGESKTVVAKQPPIADFDYHSTLPGDEAFRGRLTFYI